MNPARFSLGNARAVLFFIVALTFGGLWAYLRTPASIFPAMHFSRVEVSADAGNLPPEQVRVAVTLPLQRAFCAALLHTSKRRNRGTPASLGALCVRRFISRPYAVCMRPSGHLTYS